MGVEHDSKGVAENILFFSQPPFKNVGIVYIFYIY